LNIIMNLPTQIGIPGDWPLWRIALQKLRELENFGYGMQVETQWFEHAFGERRGDAGFAFAMLDLRGELESEDGYYLQAQTLQDEETGLKKEVWQIPSAAAHEAVARQFEGKMRRYAHRAVALRVLTLANDKAELSDAERARMEAGSRIAATRLVLLRREQAVAALVEKHAPKLLRGGK
jgi:hypothetical protein